MKQHSEVRHPDELIKKDGLWLNRFNNKLALKITNSVGTMWCAYTFLVLDVFMLPPVIKAHSTTMWVTYIAQTVLQLVLLPIIMVGQNVIQGQNDRKAEVDHRTLTYMATLQDEQMAELKNISQALDNLKKGAGK